MNYGEFQENCEELENHLYCVGTVYDSFEALLEVLGRLKLEQPLYLVYLAQKLFAHEVLNAAKQQNDDSNMPYEPIELRAESIHHYFN